MEKLRDTLEDLLAGSEGLVHARVLTVSTERGDDAVGLVADRKGPRERGVGRDPEPMSAVMIRGRSLRSVVVCVLDVGGTLYFVAAELLQRRAVQARSPIYTCLFVCAIYWSSQRDGEGELRGMFVLVVYGTVASR